MILSQDFQQHGIRLLRHGISKDWHRLLFYVKQINAVYLFLEL